MPHASPGQPTLRSRFESFRRNVVADLELRKATQPKEVLQIAAEALERDDFVRSVHAYLLEGKRLTCVSLPGALEEVPLSRREHPAVRALGRKLVTNYRDDGYIDFAAAVGLAPGPRGVIHAVLTHDDLDAYLLVRHLFQGASDRLRLLQPPAEQRVTADAPRPTSARKDLLSRVVHEISNPLAAILANLEVLRMDRGGDPVVAKQLDVLIPQVERLAGILNMARSYARSPSGATATVDLGAGLRDIVTLLKYHYRTGGVTFELDIPQELPPISGSAGELQQVWLNYFNNAFTAICTKDRPGGCLRVKASHDRSLRQLVVEITDNGVGIDTEMLSTLNSAPWTAMPGIGTREAARIIAQHEGHVEFTSRPDRGTTVRVVLPVAASERS